ncbi:PIR Superfamily Protein [Plasmodium ovale wallikeri]|uniref:PIR Superfamily Protein n=1 Tax=Plasmodium ovale wallikeri TaxID=864142 RepID=A0A1A9AII4_PLAOA|nr:PIR Superfamily Protein [Plasmodium ovale wallikeri]SBT58825.1 PIR Superfamily Protein [Plasmodium ovale wallikeri]
MNSVDCNELPISESYGFFKKFDIYESLVEDAKKNSNTSNMEKGCDSYLIDSPFPNIPFSSDICKQFKYIYNRLSNTSKSGLNTAKLENNDYAFMNYWLSDRLRDNNIDCSNFVNHVYEKLKKLHENFFTIELSASKFYNMELHDLENIKILIELYNYKDQISSIFPKLHTEEEDSASCLKHTRLFNEKYKEVIINCVDGCPDFYNSLELLKCKYNNEIIGYANSLENFQYNKLNELQDYKYVLKEYESKQFTKTITISILFPMFGLFFMLFFSNMLTPIRQLLLQKVKKIKNMWNVENRSKNLLLRSFDSENINVDNGEYNLGYYSTRIS